MRIFVIQLLALSFGLASTAAGAQQLRNPADPAPRTATTLQPPVPTATGNRILTTPRAMPALTRDANQPATPNPAISQQTRCLQTAERTIRAPSDHRIAVAQRRLAATDIQRTVNNAAARDPADRSGLRAQRNAQQAAITRERSSARQQLAIAQRNCIGD